MKFRTSNIKRLAGSIPASKVQSSLLFKGDPVVIDSNAAGEAIAGLASPEEVASEAIAQSSANDAEAAAKMAAYDALSMDDRAKVSRVMPLTRWNAIEIQKPVIGTISCENLNHWFQDMMVKYPFSGGVVTINGSDAASGEANEHVITLKPGYRNLPTSKRAVLIPAIRVNISASVLSARPGSNYSIWMTGKTEDGTDFTTEEAQYSIQRIASDKPVTFIYVPFEKESDRVVPMALKVKGDTTEIQGEGEEAHEVTIPGVEAQLHITGLTEGEVCSVTVLGYSTSELLDVSKILVCPAGIAQ